MRNRMVIAAVVALVAGGLLAAVPASAGSDGKVREYVVLYEDSASAKDARNAIADLGGTVVDEISAIGLAKVRTDNPDFAADALGRDSRSPGPLGTGSSGSPTRRSGRRSTRSSR